MALVALATSEEVGYEPWATGRGGKEIAMVKTLIFNKLNMAVLAVVLGLGYFSPAFAAVDIEFFADTYTWQRNGVYEITARIRNQSASSISIAGVQVDYNYASADFKDIAPALVQDYITGYDFAVDQVDTDTEGVVLYSKLIAEAASPNYFTLAGSGVENVVRFRYRVAHTATLGESDFGFRNEATVLERLSGGGTDSCLGSKIDALVTIAEDTTPPNTYASPSGTTLKYGNSTLVALKEVATPAYDDLQTVYYGVGEDTAPNPSVAGDWVAKDGTVQLPENDAGHPGQIAVVLKFFGRDTTGNLEFGGTDWHTENYIVDVIKPGFTVAPTRSPVRVKQGETITVEFTVDETLGPDPAVTVDGQAFAKHGSSSGNYYKYTYTVAGGETEGSRTIRIEITDLAGNQTVDTSLSVIIDMTPPSYTPVSFLPSGCDPGQYLTITFDASETLQTSGGEATVVTVAPNYNGGAAAYQSESGLRYVYSYQVSGSENSTLVRVRGFDLAGNDSYSTDGWGNIVAEGYDQYGNWGRSTGVVDVHWARETY